MSYKKSIAIILNYNGQAVLNSCVQSLLSQTLLPNEIIVVDNASCDGSIETIKKNFPQCRVVLNKKNKGFAAGMNVGLKLALKENAEYIWIINNDIRADKNVLKELVVIMEENKKFGIVSPVIFDNDNKEWFSGGKINFLRMRAEHINGELSRKKKVFWETCFVTGCAPIIRSKCLREIGLFDETFFLYYEDADLSCRALKQGWELGVASVAKVYHQEQSRVNSQKVYWLVLSGLKFFAKHSSLPWRLWQRVFIVLRKLKNKVDLIRGGGKDVQMIAKAYADFFL